MTELRCSAASLEDGEPMAGTAPSDERLLLVEYAGPWPREAVTGGRLPQPLAAWLARWPGWKAHVVRRHHRREPGTAVFAWSAGVLRGTRLDAPEDVVDLVPDTLPAYGGDLWLVCTNGARDRCCAERGRPVVAALAERWPEETWEVNHLGGHRFAGTLLHLPSGWTLGRLDPDAALAAVAPVRAGTPPLGLVRGRAGRPGEVQVAELALRAAGAVDVHWRTPAETDGDLTRVRLVADSADVTVTVHRAAGEPRRQSCADLRTKPAPVFSVRTIET